MRHISFIVLFLAWGAVLLCPDVPVYAGQPAPSSNEEPAQIPQDSIDALPDEFIEEAAAFENECVDDYVMDQYYNCECFSLAFLDKRIELGKLAPKSVILNEITDQCRDAIGAAGPVYKSCLRRAIMFKPGTDPEKFCECVANTYVEMINKYKPNIDSRRIVSYQSSAYSQCRNPDLPERGYFQ